MSANFPRGGGGEQDLFLARSLTPSDYWHVIRCFVSVFIIMVLVNAVAVNK